MSLIKKFVMVCNRCGKESQVTNATESNVNILGEEFFLCDDCLYYILDVINGKSIPVIDEPDLKMSIKRYGTPIDKNDPDQDEQDKIEFEELTDWGSDDKPAKKLVPDFDPLSSEKREYIKWDDYEVEKVMELKEQGMTWKDIGVIRKLTRPQLQQLAVRIRSAKPGSKYYTWKLKYGDMLDRTEKELKKRRAPTILTDEVVEKMFALKSQGMSWNVIAEELKLNVDSISTFVCNLKNAKPGTRMYELAKKYGYID